MLAAIQQRCPALLPMVAWAYGRHSRLLLERAEAVVLSQSGVRQGDPLGHLLSALTLQGPLKMVAELNQARPLAYADDTFLQGAPEPTIRAYQALTALAAPLGLHAQLTKCKVDSEDAAAASAVADHIELQHDPEGLLEAGTSIGTPAFQSTRADACANHTCQLMEELQALSLAAQDRWLLLNGSLQRRVTHLPRGCPWQHVGHAVQRAESKAVDGVFALLGLPRVDGPLTEQVTLPHRHGRLGLSHTSPTDGVAAYLAMHSGPEAFRPFHGPSSDVLRPQWEALHDGARDLWRADAREAGPDSLGTIAAAQSAITRRSAQFRAEALMDSYDLSTDGGKRARARLLSCACRPASAWLVTLPLSRALELKSGEVQTGLRHRLGLTMLPPNAPAVQCCCGAALRHTDFDHAMRCSALSSQLTLRHDFLKGILRRAVHWAGIASTLEPAFRHLPGLAAGAGTSADGSPIRVEADGDVLLTMPQGIAIADVSIIHPTSLNTLSRAAYTAGVAASHRDRAETNGQCQSGAQWLQLCTLLGGVLWALGPTGNDALAFVRG
jgi:hypothetical protein